MKNPFPSPVFPHSVSSGHCTRVVDEWDLFWKRTPQRPTSVMTEEQARYAARAIKLFEPMAKMLKKYRSYIADFGTSEDWHDLVDLLQQIEETNHEEQERG